MMWNNITWTSAEHSSQVCHRTTKPPHQPHPSTIIHTRPICGDILYVNGYYQYGQITATVCTKNVMLFWLYFCQKWSFWEYCGL